MKFSKILIICITFIALFLYAYDTYKYGLSIFSFIVFISSIIVFLELKSELKITSKQSEPKIKLTRRRNVERNILSDKNYLFQPRGIRRYYLNKEKDLSFRNKVGLIGKVGPRNVVTEYTLSDYEKTKPTKGKLILDQIQIMKKLGLLKKKRY